MKRLDPQTSLVTQLTALAEPLRLRIVRLLERAELSVGEVGKAVQLPQSTVSRHLRVLSDAGWTIRRNEGTATLYRVVMDDLPEGQRGLWLALRDQLAASDVGAELAGDDRRLAAVLSDRREDSRAFFGRVAGQWDEVRSELFGSSFSATGLLSLIDPDAVVADVGCGTGNIAELLAPVVRRVIAIDRSEPMLHAARQRLAGVENVEFRAGELEKLPLRPGEVDIAVCCLALHHVDDPAKALSQIAGILRAGGRILIVDMVEHDRADYRHTMGHRWLGFSEPRLSEMLEAAGFVGGIRFRELPLDTEARGPGLFACVAATGREGGHPGQPRRADVEK